MVKIRDFSKFGSAYHSVPVGSKNGTAWWLKKQPAQASSCNWSSTDHGLLQMFVCNISVGTSSSGRDTNPSQPFQKQQACRVRTAAKTAAPSSYRPQHLRLALLHLTLFCCLISLLHVGATSSKNTANAFSNIIHTKTSPLLLAEHPSDQDASELCEKQERKRALHYKARSSQELTRRLQNPPVLVRRGAWSSSLLGQQHQANTSYRVRRLLTWQGGDAASTLLCEVTGVRTANASECLWQISNLFHLLVASEMMTTNKAVQFVYSHITYITPQYCLSVSDEYSKKMKKHVQNLKTAGWSWFWNAKNAPVGVEICESQEVQLKKLERKSQITPV